MALETYRAKRDFKKTREPDGQELARRAGVAPSNRARFVVQKHDATRLHYDFRLEIDGVFKSWAVTKGPSPDPHDKRLAVEVEDHPLAYGDFEGTIPKGQYGGGTVQLWDRGYWELEGDKPVEQALADGDLKITLDGERLHGSWVLVRMKNDRLRGGSSRNGTKRNNWLLIKHRDEYAEEGGAEALLAKDRSVASGRAMDTIAAGKGKAPKPFMTKAEAPAKADAVWDSNKGEAAEGKAIEERATRAPKPRQGRAGGGLPGFIEPALASLVGKAPSGRSWLHEVKFDGYRLQARIEDGAAHLLTRTGLDWTGRFGAAVIEALAALPAETAILDGELVVDRADGVSDFSALQADLSAGRDDRFIYYAFDLLYLDGEDLRASKLTARKARLEKLLAGTDPARLRLSEGFEVEGEQMLRHACRLSLEGVVSKRKDAPYHSGRGKDWVKSKCALRQEFVIGGFVPSTTSRDAIGSLALGHFDKGRLIHVGRVGTG
jgi:bifunctional non-homologous end joining protein LigD